MIKVDLVKKDEDTSVLYFESRTTDEASISELDSLYELLMSALKRNAVSGGYDSSYKFSIELKNPQV